MLLSLYDQVFIDFHVLRPPLLDMVNKLGCPRVKLMYGFCCAGLNWDLVQVEASQADHYLKENYSWCVCRHV